MRAFAGIGWGVVGALSVMALFAAFPQLNFVARIPPIGGRTLKAA